MMSVSMLDAAAVMSLSSKGIGRLFVARKIRVAAFRAKKKAQPVRGGGI
jgi:hypothetical protein